MTLGRLPPLNPLRAFEATARHGSVTAAARELNVTHGAISHQIKALEATLDVRLFERGAQRLKLTAQGALLLPTISKAFEDIATATALMKRPTTKGELTVTCVPALLSLWLIPRMNQFTEQYPDIRLTLIATNEAHHLQSPDVDVCVLYGDGKWSDCWSRLWSTLKLFPVASPTLLNSRPLRSVRDLRNHVLLHGDDGREWNTWLAAADATDLARGAQHFMSDARLSTEAALYGQGVSLGDTITASNLIAKGELIVPFDLTVPANDAFHVACRNEVRNAPIVKVFIDWFFASLETDTITEPQTSARRIIRRRNGKISAPERVAAPPSIPTTRAKRPDRTQKRRAKADIR
ncbi:LysR substrate-binding domain-containing protein [Phyllobacterium sp. 22229]|uniref:LysR family transcriptional regulator n=1 Tax=Phyllobacterium myrsinacearum TaxID=28101 RepID=A0A2S9JPV0_9HYPH|nr:LysR substrate-binding domain-containing protein [Phyllobacterium myrsinacearum]PRD55247.1 LysR family transcriptional regulator [Phyllobacterium myrsinacearum]PWV89248.1 LysR family glycine cleavage system transcriptional activator [Phyllobacterium myrsinacearum]RZV05639.1 LysR family glycine cleavage system transcriptional activator [Phyllobacterium myrsinacearum]